MKPKKGDSPFSYAPVLKHALATPITNVLANLEIAQEQHSQNPSSHIYIQQALINARYLKNVLSLADKPVNFGLFEVNAAIAEITSLNNHKNQKYLTISSGLPDEFKISGNKLLFQEILVVLLNNAFESYSDQAITRPVFLKSKIEKNDLVITVLDGGKGMNQIEKEHCFNKHFTTKSQHSGLGLFFVKNTLKKEFSGKIELETKLGKGTKIIMRIPQKQSPIGEVQSEKDNSYTLSL